MNLYIYKYIYYQHNRIAGLYVAFICLNLYYKSLKNF